MTITATSPATAALASMPSAELHTDLVASVEMLLDQSFDGASPEAILQAVQARIQEIEVLAAQEVEFDQFSLERGMLQGLLVELANAGIVPSAQVSAQRLH